MRSREAVDGEALLRHIQDQNLDAAREVVATTEPPRDLIKALYDEFPAGASVAVRSSACAEDGDDASYAGQQETYLFVESFDEVMTRIVDCWLSFFSERALFTGCTRVRWTTSTWPSWCSRWSTPPRPASCSPSTLSPAVAIVWSSKPRSEWASTWSPVR